MEFYVGLIEGIGFELAKGRFSVRLQALGLYELL